MSRFDANHSYFLHSFFLLNNLVIFFITPFSSSQFNKKARGIVMSEIPTINITVIASIFNNSVIIVCYFYAHYLHIRRVCLFELSNSKELTASLHFCSPYSAVAVIEYLVYLSHASNTFPSNSLSFSSFL